MKQKILCIILCLLFALPGMITSANDGITLNAVFNPQTDTIEISGSGNGLITVIIPPKETELSELSDSNLPLYYNIIGAQNSIFTLKIELPSDFEGGTYTLYATDESGQMASDTLIMPSLAINSELTDALNNAPTVSQLSAAIDENSQLLGIDTADNFYIQNKESIARIILAFDKNIDGVKDFYHIYHQAYAIASLKDCTATDAELIFRNNETYLNINAEKDYKSYEYTADGAKDALDRLLAESDFATLIEKNKDKDFKKVYEELRFVAETSSATDRHTLQKIITINYKDFLKPENNTQYKNLNYPDAVFSAMISYDLSDFNKIKYAFEDSTAIACNNENSSSSGRPSSGGGGGGSVGGGITLPAPTEKTETEKNEELKPVFDDVAIAHWANTPITTLASKGIITGYGSEFMPDKSITRAEFVTLIYRTFRLNPSTSQIEFEDVSEKDWYYEYVQTAANNAIILGDGNGAFRPNDSITRQDACVIINRAISVYGINLKPGKAVSFDDKNQIALYALSDISILFANGVVKGTSDTTFEPEAQITRAQTAQLVYNTMSNLKILDLV